MVEGEDAYHLLKVLRLKEGQHFIVSDKDCTDFICEAVDTREGSIKAKIVKSEHNRAEKAYTVHLLNAVLKGEKTDFVLQKAVEAGADKIGLFYSVRSEVKYDKAKAEKKQRRWEKIIYEAAKQCGRGRIPALTLYPTFKEMLASCADRGEDVIFAYEEARGDTLRTALEQSGDALCFIVGPVGGFDKEEVRMAKAAGAHVVTLGNRILRAETAGIFMLSCCVYEKEL